jgi:metal-sulfur cluster biosynthetic enzyme
MNREQILDTLKSVFDPEVGVNIVDLGLVYKVDLQPEELKIQITMTSPACPLHGVITRNIDKVLRQAFPGLGRMTIEVIWDPPWSPDRMSAAARQQLGWK